MSNYHRHHHHGVSSWLASPFVFAFSWLTWPLRALSSHW